MEQTKSKEFVITIDKYDREQLDKVVLVLNKMGYISDSTHDNLNRLANMDSKVGSIGSIHAFPDLGPKRDVYRFYSMTGNEVSSISKGSEYIHANDFIKKYGPRTDDDTIKLDLIY